MKSLDTTKVRPTPAVNEDRTAPPLRLENGRMFDEEQDQANYVHHEAQHRPRGLITFEAFGHSSLLSFMRKEPLS